MKTKVKVFPLKKDIQSQETEGYADELEQRMQQWLDETKVKVLSVAANTHFLTILYQEV